MSHLRRFLTPRGGGGVTSSLSAFKIKAKDLGEGLKSDQIKIEIKLYSFASISTLELTSWNSINQISELGLASEFFKVGDEKTVLINNVTYAFVILGFNHDNKSDGSGTAGITFGMKNLLATTYKMNTLNINSGGWNNCYMRKTHMKTFFNQLSGDLQSVIKEVNKKATGGGYNNTTIVTSQDKLFLFSQREINGDYNDEGSQYEHYKSESKVKSLSNGSGSLYGWWLRSHNVSSYFSYFRYVGSGGGIGNSDGDSTFGVCFGFCV